MRIAEIILNQYRLDDTQEELLGDQPFFGHPPLAHIPRRGTGAFRADGRQVVEHHGQLLRDHGAEHPGHDLGHRRLVIDQRIQTA